MLRIISLMINQFVTTYISCYKISMNILFFQLFYHNNRKKTKIRATPWTLYNSSIDHQLRTYPNRKINILFQLSIKF